jgi:hypothetical protein
MTHGHGPHASWLFLDISLSGLSTLERERERDRASSETSTPTATTGQPSLACTLLIVLRTYSREYLSLSLSIERERVTQTGTECCTDGVRVISHQSCQSTELPRHVATHEGQACISRWDQNSTTTLSSVYYRT